VKLIFQPRSGNWLALTDDERFDATHPDPMAAAANLVDELDRHIKELEEG